VDEIRNSADLEDLEKKLHKELLLALESARTRLAIVIASEKKTTLPSRWQYYLDTTDQIGLSIRALRRAAANDLALASWTRALETLKKISSDEQADQLCRTLREVVKALAQCIGKQKTAVGNTWVQFDVRVK